MKSFRKCKKVTLAAYIALALSLSSSFVRAQSISGSATPDSAAVDLETLIEDRFDSQEKAPEQPENPETLVGTIPVTPLGEPDTRQSEASPSPNTRGMMDEVVVTARRVAESMQDVPVAISAMSSDDLRREAINSPQDLQGRVPSLIVGANTQMRNNETPQIRGQGTNFGAAPGVIIYMAEVPLPADVVANHQGGPGKFFDLQNLQILKGSQGTLFGRNTTGGAMLLEPTRPQDDFSGYVRAEGTSFNGQGYEGVINIPLIDDSLLMRAGIKYFDREGFTRDVVTGKDYDSKHFWTSRLGLTWRPSDRVESYLLGYYTDSKDNGTGTVIEEVNREGVNQAIPTAIGLGVLSQIPGVPLDQIANLGCLVVNVYAPSRNCGDDIVQEQRERGVRRVQLSGDPNDIIKTGGIINHLSFELSDRMTLRNIASYSTFDHHYRWDLDGSRGEYIDYNNTDDMFQADLYTITEELQLQGTGLDGLLSFVVGGYYEYTEASGEAQATALFVQGVIQNYSQVKQSYAPFAQGTLDLGAISDTLSGLNLTAGARYTFDKTTGRSQLLQRALGAITLADARQEAKIKDSALTFTVGLDYKFDSHLIYGKISRGYKTGGTAPTSVAPTSFTYDAEYVLNYEIGHKSDFEIVGIPARINSAIFLTDYTDLQKAGTDTFLPPNSINLTPQFGAAIFNAGKATVAGFEFEGTIIPSQNLTLNATFGYTKATYDEFNLLIGGADLPPLSRTT